VNAIINLSYLWGILKGCSKCVTSGSEVQGSKVEGLGVLSFDIWAASAVI
jgi:hypothetical protein